MSDMGPGPCEVCGEDLEIHTARERRECMKDYPRRDWFDKLDSQGVKAIEILAGFTGFEQAWFEHIVMDRMEHAANPCKCRILGGERQEACPKWVAMKRYKDAEQALERAKKDLQSAHNSLTSYE